MSTVRPLLALLLLEALGCKERPPEPAAAARYQAVKATPASASHWCDETFAGDARRLTLPPLATPDSQAATVLPKNKRVWVNLWATWCQPCLREMPLLLKWQDDLRKDGVDVDVLFLSLDEDAATLGEFLARRKDIPAQKVQRVASQQGYEQWVKAYLKDPSTPIPIHLLASADGSLRCLRSGSLREGDYPAAKAALR